MRECTSKICSSLLLFVVACGHSAESQFVKEEQDRPEIVILDTDMGSDCDDVGALALLHAYANQGDVEILSVVYTSGAVPYGAGVVDAINTYYGRPDLPVGADHELTFGDPVDKMSAEKLARDRAAFGHDIVHNEDAPEQTRLSRALLSKQPDQSVTYVTIGHTKGLYELLTSKPDSASSLTGRELVSAKVRRWVALGALRSDEAKEGFAKDWNFFFNGTASYTHYLVESMPIPIYFVDAGHDVMTGRSLQLTPAGNIVRTAYRDWLWNVMKQTLTDQRPSWDLATVQFAVQGYGEFLEPGAKGYLLFDSLQGSRWVTGANDRDHFLVKQKPNVTDAYADYLNDFISKNP